MQEDVNCGIDTRKLWYFEDEHKHSYLTSHFLHVIVKKLIYPQSLRFVCMCHAVHDDCGWLDPEMQGYIVFSSVIHCCFETGGWNHESCWSCRRHSWGMFLRPCVLQMGTPTKVSGPKTADCFAMGNGVGCYHWSDLVAKIVCRVKSAHSRGP